MTSPKQAVERTYLAPTLVVGVGNLGLSVLESLGEDWDVLRRSGGDVTLRNLRLLYVAPEQADDRPWRHLERRATSLARHAGESDLPSLATNLVILRSVGLVRFRDGSYQVALPRDGGPVAPTEVLDAVEVGEGVRRRRYFDWLSLSPDPVTAVERLYHHAESTSELDLFITPIINRIRQGHSPRALLACIGRCHALAGGRDPSPWGWVKELAQRVEAAGEASGAGGLRLRLAPDDRRSDELLGLCPTDVRPVSRSRPLGQLDQYAPPPVSGWQGWLEGRNGGGEGGDKDRYLALRVPKLFVPHADDVGLCLDPLELLKVDWETTGWATGGGGAADGVEFKPLEASPFRLGLFDHDGTRRLPQGGDGGLGERLGVLAQLARRGLMRLWMDLQRDRVEEKGAQPWAEDRRRESSDDALRQSLEILGELLVRPLAEAETSSSRDQDIFPPASAATAVPVPTPTLEGQRLGEPNEQPSVAEALARRLGHLGIPVEPTSAPRPRLLETLRLGSGDVAASSYAETVNGQVRDLLHLDLLSQYRQRPIRRPPRLTLYLVADMGEPFARATVRAMLQETHAELLRSFSPIFENYREGFDRALSIVPILWMPHPADPFSGRASPHRREEESAIIDAVQGVRRWVESVIPGSRRRVSQIFINSYLTESAVLSRHHAVRQTRDFITLQTRNDLGADEWLRRTAIGPMGDDFFSSFACYELEFPVEKAGQYLANRLARELLSRLVEGYGDAAVEVETAYLRPPSQEDLVEGAEERLARLTEGPARSLAEWVEGRAEVTPETTFRELLERFDERFGQQVFGAVQRVWISIVEHRGEMDEMVDGLRRGVSRRLGKTLQRVRDHSDRCLEDLAGSRGLPAIHTHFSEVRLAARAHLEDGERRRRQAELRCLAESLPVASSLEAARLWVLDAVRSKPDLQPMYWGFALWLVLSPVLAAPVVRTLSRLLDLAADRRLAVALDAYGPWTGALVAAVVGSLYLQSVLGQALRRLRERIRGLTSTCRHLIDGGGAGPSVRSFFAARLHLAGALAERGFASRVCDQARVDCRLADRLSRSVEAQIRLLRHQAEGLGVRPSFGLGEREEAAGLFHSSQGQEKDQLVDGSTLSAYFERRWGHEREQMTLVPPLLQAVGGMGQWRRFAPLSDSTRILDHCRLEFHFLLQQGLTHQHPFAEEARRRLRDFVAQHFANIGFGARFSGSEGLDPDGVHVLAEAALVLHPELHATFSRRGDGDAEGWGNRTQQIIPCRVRPNVAYMLSLAQGIRPHTVRNLRRFESFHDRTALSEDRTFPLSRDDDQGGSINHLSSYDSLATALVRRLGADGGDGQ